jgi:hypothetical protein
MNLTLRLGTPDDANRCRAISYKAFKAIAEHHRFPPDLPSPQVAVANFARRHAHPGYYSAYLRVAPLTPCSLLLPTRAQRS